MLEETANYGSNSPTPPHDPYSCHSQNPQHTPGSNSNHVLSVVSLDKLEL